MFYYTERFKTKYHSRRSSDPEWIVVHYTGTAASGLANARAIEKELKRPRSTHYFIDGEQVIAVVKEKRAAWHIGGKNAKDCKKIPVWNGNSIGVDLCEDKLIYDRKHKSVDDDDWFFDDETETTAAELIAGIMKKYEIKIENVVRHYDVTGKMCPRPFCGDDINKIYKESGNNRWQQFKALIMKYYEEIET